VLTFLLVGFWMAVWGTIACSIAQAKNRSAGEWFFLGSIWGAVAILRLLWLPALPPQGRRQDAPDLLVGSVSAAAPRNRLKNLL
jgi:hypothetical protein